MTEVDHRQVVQEMWPTTGPHTADSLSAAAVAYREIARMLANATLLRRDVLRALPTVPDGYTVLGGLAEAASSERQTLDQLANWAEHFATDQSLRHDAHRDQPDGGIEQSHHAALGTAEDLREAARHADALTRALRSAQARAGHLYHHDEEDR